MVELPAQSGLLGESGRVRRLGGGRHRRAETAEVEAVAQYELLVLVLRSHRPSERAGLCLVCGTGWPCAEVLLPLRPGGLPGQLRRVADTPDGTLSRVHG